MNIKKFAILICTVLFAMVFAACSKTGSANLTNDKTEDENNEYKPKVISKELNSYDLESGRKDEYEADLWEFDLGAKEYISNDGVPMPYNVRGIIGAPKKPGKYPLVLITHGSHSNDDENLRFDTGFDYLVEALANNGFIVVSMDMSKPYIWKYGDNQEEEKSPPLAREHILALIEANSGSDPGYGISLEDKIDFDNVGLLGHSRGGEIIYTIANELSQDDELGNVNFRAFLSLAPTYLSDREWPDADTAIIVPELDGDVISLDGYNSYRYLTSESQGSHNIILVKNANHNFFNKNIERNDALMLANEEELTYLLSREDHQDFLTNFSIDFFQSSLLEANNSFINMQDKTLVNTMYGYDVLVMQKNSDSKDIVDIQSLDGLIAKNKATAHKKIDSWFYKDDEIIIDTITAPEEPFNLRHLINVKWHSNEDSLSIDPMISDFTGYNSLNIDLVMDAADDLNDKSKASQFSLAIQDKLGNITNLTLPENLNVLKAKDGEILTTELEDLDINYWSKPTPLGSIRVPLNELENIDLGNIESISLVFDKISSGSLFIDSVYLSK